MTPQLRSPRLPRFPRFVRRRMPSQVALLRQAPSLRHAEPRRLAWMAGHADRLRFPPGKTILTAGHAARELVVVLEGEAHAVHPDGRRTTLGPGTELGARELLAREATPHTVVASTTLDVLVINGPAVRWAYSEGLCRLVRPAVADADATEAEAPAHEPRPRASRPTPAAAATQAPARPARVTIPTRAAMTATPRASFTSTTSFTEGACASATRPPAPGR